MWESTLQQIHTRDNEIEATAEDFQKIKTETAAAARTLAEHMEFLKQEEANNVDVDKQVVAMGI